MSFVFIEQLMHLSSQNLKIHFLQDNAWGNYLRCEENEISVEFEHHTTTFDLSDTDVDDIASLDGLHSAIETFESGALKTINVSLLGQSTKQLLVPRAKRALYSVESLRSIGCRACQSRIVDGQRFEKILPLPSTGWLELSELWNCCCSHAHKHNNDENDNCDDDNKKNVVNKNLGNIVLNCFKLFLYMYIKLFFLIYH
jgi:hypothetical protein